jgi:hypothetical protein
MKYSPALSFRTVLQLMWTVNLYCFMFTKFYEKNIPRMNHLRTPISSYFYLALIHALGVFPELLHLLFKQLTERLLCLRQNLIRIKYGQVCGSRSGCYKLRSEIAAFRSRKSSWQTLHKHTKYCCNTHPWFWAGIKKRTCSADSMRKSGNDPLSTVLQNETTVEVPTRAELKATNIPYQFDTLLALTTFKPLT